MRVIAMRTAPHAQIKPTFMLLVFLLGMYCPLLSAQNSDGAASHRPVRGTSTRASILTYRNTQYGVSLEYPANYVLTEGEMQLGADWVLAGGGDHYEQPHRVMLVTVEFPGDAYPGTDFGGAFVNISISPERTRADCEALLNSSDSKPRTTVINGTRFSWSTAAQASMGKGEGESDYVTFRRGICYEITVASVILPGELSAVGGERNIPVDSKDVERRLEVILHSLTIRATK